MSGRECGVQAVLSSFCCFCCCCCWGYSNTLLLGQPHALNCFMRRSPRLLWTSIWDDANEATVGQIWCARDSHGVCACVCVCQLNETLGINYFVDASSPQAPAPKDIEPLHLQHAPHAHPHLNRCRFFS